MTIQEFSQDPEVILKRIDAAIIELQALRQAVLVFQPLRAVGLTRQLYGALGHGSWAEYDFELDWQQFDT